MAFGGGPVQIQLKTQPYHLVTDHMAGVQRCAEADIQNARPRWAQLGNMVWSEAR